VIVDGALKVMPGAPVQLAQADGSPGKPGAAPQAGGR